MKLMPFSLPAKLHTMASQWSILRSSLPADLPTPELWLAAHTAIEARHNHPGLIRDGDVLRLHTDKTENWRTVETRRYAIFQTRTTGSIFTNAR